MIHSLLTLLYLVPSLPVPPSESDPLANTDAAVWTPPRDPSGVSAPQKVRARIATVGTQLQYAALWLDGDGDDQVYVKAQQKDSSGRFHGVYFYRGEGVGGWPGMTGGSAVALLGYPFESADMTLEHDGAGNVKVTFSNPDPPAPDQVFERGGWVPRNGAEFGIAGYTGAAAIDDFSFGDNDTCDDFNRPDGPLGEDWELRAGSDGVIRDGRAFVGLERVRARFAYVGRCFRCAYKLKKSKPRRGCETCPTMGGRFESDARCNGVEDCRKRIRARITCPSGIGTCRIKGKRRACG